jgi:hypothetical protein
MFKKVALNFLLFMVAFSLMVMHLAVRRHLLQHTARKPAETKQGFAIAPERQTNTYGHAIVFAVDEKL